MTSCVPEPLAPSQPADATTPTTAPIFSETVETDISTALPPTSQPVQRLPDPDLVVQVDANQDVHPISPLIYGVSAGSEEILRNLRPTLNSWGGNPSSRFNWEIGHAWNAGRDWFFRNGNYGYPEGSVSDSFISEAMAAGIEVRLAAPTLGWVAKNDDNDTCSFPTPDGGCWDAQGVDCSNPLQIADPTLANVPSDPASITDWMQHIYKEKGFEVRFVAMDNEPELWGHTHYDVHPDCATYDEILAKHLEYSKAVLSVAPQVEIAGPVTCCWYFYWNSAAGEADKLQHGGEDFLPWFLDQVHQHDQESGVQSLHVFDIHYYPEGLFNQDVDPETAAHRLRSTRSLWDPEYVDESWINEPVYLIPRMQALIQEHYPGLRLGISEWNWGADQDINGALAIADVLGIYGREGVYLAAYWTHPPLDSPGFFAFKLYTNFDDRGGRYGGADGGISVQALSDDPDRVSSFAAIDSSGSHLYLMLINKDPQTAVNTQVDLTGFGVRPLVMRYQYGPDRLDGITSDTVTVQPADLRMTLPASSITLLVLDHK